MKKLILITTVLTAVALAGCNGSDRKMQLRKQLAELQKQTDSIKSEMQKCRKKNSELHQRIDKLSAIRKETPLSNIYNITGIKIGRFTGLYDKNNDNKKESLIVYIQPMDHTGDIIKAPGSVYVELWNLNKKQNALIRQWHITPEKLKELWFSTVMTINYRLTFDISDKLENREQPLTLKVRFTDYISGKTFEEQTLIKP